MDCSTAEHKRYAQPELFRTQITETQSLELNPAEESPSEAILHPCRLLRGC